MHYIINTFLHYEVLYCYEVLIQVIGCVCILLDDIQYMDLLSWQFLSYALNNSRVVIVMTATKHVPWDDLFQVENSILRDKRLMIKMLDDLEPKYLAAFACQFLNVVAIPSTFEK